MIHHEAWYKEDTPRVAMDQFIPATPSPGMKFVDWFPTEVQRYLQWANLPTLPDTELSKVKERFKAHWDKVKAQQKRENQTDYLRKYQQKRKEEGKPRPQETPEALRLRYIRHRQKLLEDPARYQAWLDKRRKRYEESHPGATSRPVDPIEDIYRKQALQRAYDQALKEAFPPSPPFDWPSEIEDSSEYQDMKDIRQEVVREKSLPHPDQSKIEILQKKFTVLWQALYNRYRKDNPKLPFPKVKDPLPRPKSLEALPGIQEDPEYRVLLRLRHALQDERDRPLPDQERVNDLKDLIQNLYLKLYKRHRKTSSVNSVHQESWYREAALPNLDRALKLWDENQIAIEELAKTFARADQVMPLHVWKNLPSETLLRLPEGSLPRIMWERETYTRWSAVEYVFATEDTIKRVQQKALESGYGRR